MHAGVVVAGGRSTRFGDADKATADLAGVPMVRRVADRIAGPVDELVVNCRAGQRGAFEAALDGYPRPVTYAVDADPDSGPLSGMRDGLRATDADLAFVAACDMPFLDPGFVRYLFDRAAAREAALPKRTYREALHAVYRPEPTATACTDALARGERRALAAAADLDAAVVGAEEIAVHAVERTFENVNTRAAFERAAERLD